MALASLPELQSIVVNTPLCRKSNGRTLRVPTFEVKKRVKADLDKEQGSVVPSEYQRHVRALCVAPYSDNYWLYLVMLVRDQFDPLLVCRALEDTIAAAVHVVGMCKPCGTFRFDPLYRSYAGLPPDKRVSQAEYNRFMQDAFKRYVPFVTLDQRHLTCKSHFTWNNADYTFSQLNKLLESVKSELRLVHGTMTSGIERPLQTLIFGTVVGWDSPLPIEPFAVVDIMATSGYFDEMAHITTIVDDGEAPRVGYIEPGLVNATRRISFSTKRDLVDQTSCVLGVGLKRYTALLQSMHHGQYAIGKSIPYLRPDFIRVAVFFGLYVPDGVGLLKYIGRHPQCELMAFMLSNYLGHHINDESTDCLDLLVEGERDRALQFCETIYTIYMRSFQVYYERVRRLITVSNQVATTSAPLWPLTEKQGPVGKTWIRCADHTMATACVTNVNVRQKTEETLQCIQEARRSMQSSRYSTAEEVPTTTICPVEIES